MLLKIFNTGFFFLLYMAVCFMPRLHAQQQEQAFIHYTAKDGLSNNQITAMAQDKRGFLWISTYKGLNRFNGKEFARYHSSADKNSLPADDISRLQWLDDNRLACVTNMGLHIINTQTGIPSNLIIPAGELKYGYKVNSLTTALGNEQGDVFLLTRSGFYHFDKNAQLVFRFDYYTKEDAETKAFGFGAAMLQLDEHLFMLQTINGPYVYNCRNRILEKVNNNNYPFLTEFNGRMNVLTLAVKQGIFIAIKLLSDTIIYADFKNKKRIISRLPFIPEGQLGYRSQLFRVNDSSFYLTGFNSGYYKLIIDSLSGNIKFYPEKYFTGYYCSALLKDRENNFWIATGNGLFRQQINKSFAEIAEIPANSAGRQSAAQVEQVFVFKDKIYAACRREGGLVVFDKHSMKTPDKISFKKHFRFSDNIFSIAHAANDTLLIATYGPLFWLKTSTGQTGEVPLKDWDREHNWVAAQFSDSRGSIWISSNSDALYSYKTSEKKISVIKTNQTLCEKINVPFHITEDKEGHIWLGGHGLCRFNTQTARFDQLLDSFPFIRFPRKEIDALTADENNLLWFANAYNGLINYNQITKKFQQFTAKQGLPDNSIRALYILKNKIWIATNSGMACLDLKTSRIANFGADDGFPPVSMCGNRFFYDAQNNQLYIGWDNRVIRFNPDSLLMQYSPPDFFIASIRFANDSVSFYPPEKISMPHYRNSFSITLDNVNYTDANNQRFMYRLLHTADTAWQLLSNLSAINFNNLSPGTYQLQVKMFAANNRWPEQIRTMTITIQPPFWKTGWFITLTGLLSAAIIYFLYKARIRYVKKKAVIDKQLREYEMKALHAQMNPHFIFNSLNSIQEMILENEKQNAGRYLSKFAQLIRTNLEQSRQTFITVKQCIDHLQQYLEMEKIRFDNFTYTIEADKDLPATDIRIAPMLVQPLAENAIWHGLKQPGNKKICIRFYQTGRQLVCEVEDNGPGIDQTLKNKTASSIAHRPLGIGNIRERLKVLNEKYDMNCSLDIFDKSALPDKTSSGTLAILRLSIQTALL